MQANLCTSFQDELHDHRANNFNSQVLRGEIWTAVRLITKREKGGEMQPSNTCSKTGEPVLEMIWGNILRPTLP